MCKDRRCTAWITWGKKISINMCSQRRDAIVLIIMNTDFSPLDDVSRDNLKSFWRGVVAALLIFTWFIVRVLTVFYACPLRMPSKKSQMMSGPEIQRKRWLYTKLKEKRLFKSGCIYECITLYYVTYARTHTWILIIICKFPLVSLLTPAITLRYIGELKKLFWRLEDLLASLWF